jgi:zinc/manganese transport system permease protein
VSEFLGLMAAPFAACLVLLGLHVYMGIHVLARGVIFVDLALAQLAALGATAALWAGSELEGDTAWWVSLGVALVGAVFFALTRMREGRIPQEAIIGITYVVAAAAAILGLDRAPHGGEEIKGMLVGSILWVSWPVVGRTAAVYAALGLFHWLFRQRLLLISLEPERARAEGLSLRLWDFAFYASFAVMIALSVPVAGVLLVFSFLIVPAVCGALLAQGVAAQLLVGWGIGLAASVAGCYLSYALDLPTGATVVCTFGVALVGVAVGRWVTACR